MKVLKMMDLMERARLIENSELRWAVTKYIEHNAVLICSSPASISHHHNWKGGLLQHTCEVHDIAITLAMGVRNRDRLVDMDSIRASTILHDLGKIFIYEPSNNYNGRFVYKSKRLPDHAVLVVTDFQEITKYTLPRNIHLNILSHEGGWSRTGVSPDTLEASIVASADLVSSRLDSANWM